MNKKQKRMLCRIIVTFVLFVALMILEKTNHLEFLKESANGVPLFALSFKNSK